MDIYEKIKAGEVISDSDFAACNETPLDIIRFFEKELKVARNKAKKRLLDKLSLIQEREELKKATITLAEGLHFQQERADKYKQALDEIEKFAKENVELLEGYHLEQANCLTILTIIEELKGGK